MSDYDDDLSDTTVINAIDAAQALEGKIVDFFELYTADYQSYDRWNDVGRFIHQIRETRDSLIRAANQKSPEMVVELVNNSRRDLAAVVASALKSQSHADQA